MNTRINFEKRETQILSKYATLSKDSIGRRELEEKCEIRTEFQRDRDRIIHSKAFRRLKHKTQVFISPEGDHFRTRLTHTLEVSQIARTIGRSLLANEDLIEAIALGHDLGHTPFGHTGERVLDRISSKGFRHNHQSLRVVDFLESNKSRRGLNLTYEVRDGIKNHSGNKLPSTLEGQIVRYADRIAYLNHDIDDAIRAGIIKKEEIPREITDILGPTHSTRIDTMIRDIVKNSQNSKTLKMSKEISKAANDLRKFMFDKVYLDKVAKSEEGKAKNLIESLYKYYMTEGILPKSHLKLYEGLEKTSREDIVIDYIAGMTDRYAINRFKDIYIPENWDIY